MVKISDTFADFCRMSDTLGNAWWAERRRTNKKYLANIHVLNRANRGDQRVDNVHPVEIRMPSVRGKALIRLRLGKHDLELKEVHKRIKRIKLQALLGIQLREFSLFCRFACVSEERVLEMGERQSRMGACKLVIGGHGMPEDADSGPDREL